MTDKVQKIREEVEKLKSQLLRGACSSQIAMETMCKEEAYNEVLAILDTMQEQHKETNFLDELKTKLDSMSKEEFEQVWGKYGAEEKEELVSSIWHDASEKSNEPEDVVIINPSDNTGEVLTNCTGVYSGRIWSYTSDLLNLDNPCKIGKNLQEEPVSEELEKVSDKYSEDIESDYSNDMFDRGDIMKAFEAGANWQKEKDSTVSEDLEEASKEWLKPQLDKSYANYGEVKMMELTHFDGYAMLDAIEFGAKWKEKKMMRNAIDVTVHIDSGGYPYIPQIEFYDYDKDVPLAKKGDKYKVVLIKYE